MENKEYRPKKVRRELSNKADLEALKQEILSGLVDYVNPYEDLGIDGQVSELIFELGMEIETASEEIYEATYTMKDKVVGTRSGNNTFEIYEIKEPTWIEEQERVAKELAILSAKQVRLEKELSLIDNYYGE